MTLILGTRAWPLQHHSGTRCIFLKGKTDAGIMVGRREEQAAHPRQEEGVGEASKDTSVLDFSNAYYGDDKCAEIAEAVRQATFPVRLDLRGNRFEATGAKVLAEMLKTRHGVVSLCLEWNNVGLLDEGVEALAGALELDARLLELDLRNNNIGPEGARALAKAMKRNKTLRKLDLRWNEIGNAGVLAFLEALQTNHSLLALELSGNNSSFKHAEEIERLLARNRSIQGQKPGLEPEQNPANSPNKPAIGPGHGDQLLLQVLAEKEALETDLNVVKRQGTKLSEKIEENELQIQMLRKELESVKEDRNRYQQREIDAKAETHEAKMRFEELENRRRVEFEEYRTARATLERECNVLRDKLSHSDSLHKQNDDQKSKQITQLDELKYKLESEVHRLTLAATAKEEDFQKLKKQLQDVVKEHERKEQKQESTHSAELAAASRQHEQTLRALQSQLAYTTEQLAESKRSATSLIDRVDELQASLLQTKVAHEKELNEIKKQFEIEMHDRMQRSVAAIEAQVEEVKNGRLFLEREVEKHLDTILRLRQENISLQQAHDERLQALQQELDRQFKDLQDKQDQLSAAIKESVKVNEKMQQHQRRADEQERNLVRTKEMYEDRIRDTAASAESAKRELQASIKEKIALIARLEAQTVRLQRALTNQTHEHEQRLDHLAESFTSFIQNQMARERERGKRVVASDRSAEVVADMDNPMTGDVARSGGVRDDTAGAHSHDQPNDGHVYG